MLKHADKIQFGDFQTPQSLARDICHWLRDGGVRPASIVEPTCGVGSFVVASAELFPDARILGVELRNEYVKDVAQHTTTRFDGRVTIEQGNFFRIDWDVVLSKMPDPVLILGNPPWVTNSGMQSVGGNNLPLKSNFQGMTGIEAITGKANFDISEWMMFHLIDASDGRNVTIAMILKTSAARKALQHIWNKHRSVASAEMRLIDAKNHFNASVPACVLLLRFVPNATLSSCEVYSDLLAKTPIQRVGWMNSTMIADVGDFQATRHLAGKGEQWRSGIKHDCSKVMELKKVGPILINGFNERVDIERNYVYPLYKSSQVAGGSTETDRFMIVPQRRAGDETSSMSIDAPLTWAYLTKHEHLFTRRRSSIYRGRPKFAVFGVGDYSFSPWKVAVSGFYANFHFSVIGPKEGKPPVFDDTVYFLPCKVRDEADFIAGMLNSPLAQRFFSSYVFWDAKRPVTTALLRLIDVRKLAQALGVEDRLLDYRSASLGGAQQQLFVDQ